MKSIRILEDGNRLIVVLEGYEKGAVTSLIDALVATKTPLNIRILEDGNRLITVLEGYEKSVVVNALGSAATSLNHIKPHTGKTQFKLKGTEKEVQTLTQEQKQETKIKPPAFMEKMMADKEAGRTQEAETKEAREAKRKEVTSKEAAKMTPASKRTSKCQEEEPFTPPVLPDNFMPLPEPADDIETNTAETKVQADKSAETSGTANIESAKAKQVRAQVKQVDRMSIFELKAYVRQADLTKLSFILRKKGRFPNAAHLLNSDDRTIRGYVKDLILTA